MPEKNESTQNKSGVPRYEGLGAGKLDKTGSEHYNPEKLQLSVGTRVNDCSDKTLRLKEERLEISKKKVITSEVTVHKEVFTEEKMITVPIKREELVIVKKVLDDKNAALSGEDTETIRIPLTEERIDIVKHTIPLKDVKVYKQQFQEIEHIEAALKKEKINIDKSGDVIVINQNDENG
jgi:uncharacterized protein (TIGR02271 family)